MCGIYFSQRITIQLAISATPDLVQLAIPNLSSGPKTRQHQRF
jgi:hypothetical protein